MGEVHERCWLCTFWNGSRCTNTWRLVIHVEPGGGQVDFSTMPGMVPEHLKEKLNDYFGKLVVRFLLPLVERMPVWNEIREFQEAREENRGCPGRTSREDIKPYLHIVRTQL